MARKEFETKANPPPPDTSSKFMDAFLETENFPAEQTVRVSAKNFNGGLSGRAPKRSVVRAQSARDFANEWEKQRRDPLKVE